MKILYVTTISNTVNAFLIPHISMLIEQGHQVDVAFNVVQELRSELSQLGCKIIQVDFQRTPFHKGNLIAYTQLDKLMSVEKYDVVHTHTPVASTISRLVCRKYKQTKLIYTAHGFHFYKGAPILNWLIYYPIEKLLSRYTDVLFTINQEDYKRAVKRFKSCKVEYLPGVGISIENITNYPIDKTSKRDELNIEPNDFTIVSIGELNNNKNHEVVIKAIARLSKVDIKYIICGVGSLENSLQELINKLNLSKQVKLLGYRRDIIEICKVSDLFVFPSLREGLPVSVMEAMACGLPLICSNIRGNKDLLIDQKGGFLFEPTNVIDLAEKIDRFINDPNIAVEYGKYNLEYITKYDIGKIIPNILNITNREEP